VAADTPEEISKAFAAAINGGDIDGALDLWSEDAAIVGPDGAMTRGREAIAGVLQALIGNGANVHIELTGLYATADSALATGTLRMSVPGHEPYEGEDSIVLYTRAADGSWRVAIDAPWGLPGT
jgi:uncharacterized protein (TIGR02246 family)